MSTVFTVFMHNAQYLYYCKVAYRTFTEQ